MPSTSEIWFYDYRTNIHHTPKKNPLKIESLNDFVVCYNPKNIKNRKETWNIDNPEGRWKKFSYDEIIMREKANLDITWIKDESSLDYDNLPEPDDLINDMIENLGSALTNLKAIKDSIGFS